jgi:hypothetical protein
MDMRKKTFWILLVCSLSAAAAFAQATGRTLPPPPPPAQPACRITATYQGGLVDNYGVVLDPRVWSTALTAYMFGKQTRQYDEEGCDKFLGESFRIGKCQICETLCTAEVEIRYKPSDCGLECNDTITVGLAPFSGAGTIVTSVPLYGPCPPPDPTGTDPAASGLRRSSITPGGAVTKRFPLDVGKLKALCAKTPGSVFWLDMIVQDDTNVDWIKLILTYN